MLSDISFVLMFITCFFFLPWAAIASYASSQSIIFKYKQSLSPPTQRQVFTWNLFQVVQDLSMEH